MVAPFLTRWQSLLEQGKAFYHRYEKYFPIVFFFGGFGWDSLTLTRIDRMSDNLIFLAYFLLAGLCIALIQWRQKGVLQKPLLLKYAHWYPLALQFFLGGLFSGYVVFYFQSAAFTKSWLFLLLLVILLVANEFLEKRLDNLRLVITLYFIAAFSFFIFFIPVLIKKMNVLTFLSGAIIGLAIVFGLLYWILRKSGEFSPAHLLKIGWPVAGLLVLLVVFYFQNWIPPVPLSLKTGKIYHHVAKKGDLYEVRFEKPRWYQFFKDSDKTFRYLPGDTVFCFTSIFAPTRLTKTCYHHWQVYHPQKKEWLTTDRLAYAIFGGRDGGYRGYTYKRNVTPGKWRVDVETEEGMLLGRIGFHVVAAEDSVREFEIRMQ